MRDTTIGHFHVDPIFIQQPNALITLEPGQILYLDDDGFYKPAMAISNKQINIAGVVWQITPDGFYLRTEPGPMEYRLPLPPSYFAVDMNGRPNERLPDNIKIPGNFGQALYLSETVPGGLQSAKPEAYAIIVGYKTSYGFLFRPDFSVCCSTAAVSGTPCE